MADKLPEIGRTIRKVPADELDELIAKYGEPLIIDRLIGNPCATRPPGAVCKVYRCINGVRLILKCNTSKGCTDGEEVTCTGD